MKSVSLDKTDRKILRLLQQNARMTVKEIASRLYMSSPAISARIAKLEEAGVIRGYHADIDPAFLGYTIKAFVNLEVDPKQKEEFYSFIENIDNVIECSFVTGDYSMLIETLFEDTSQLDHFVNRLQSFGHTKTLIAFSTAIPQRPVPVK